MSFRDTLNHATETVKTWPRWKQNMLGPSLPKENEMPDLEQTIREIVRDEINKAGVKIKLEYDRPKVFNEEKFNTFMKETMDDLGKASKPIKTANYCPVPGRECPLPVGKLFIEEAAGCLRFFETDIFRQVEIGDWYITFDGNKIVKAHTYNKGSERWILRAELLNANQPDGSEYYRPVKGRKCELPVWNSDREKAAGLVFYETLVYGELHQYDWFIESDGIYIMQATSQNPRGEFWILRAEPVQQFKVGDWAYCVKCKELFIIESISHGLAWDIRKGYWHSIKDIRQYTDADWTREIGGVKFRVYEISKGEFILYSNKSHAPTYFAKDERPIVEALGVPIMPYSLSHGEFKRPE